MGVFSSIVLRVCFGCRLSRFSRFVVLVIMVLFISRLIFFISCDIFGGLLLFECMSVEVVSFVVFRLMIFIVFVVILLCVNVLRWFLRFLWILFLVRLL